MDVIPHQSQQPILPVYFVSVPVSEWNALRNDIKTLLDKLNESEDIKKDPYMKSSEVIDMLKISQSTLERYKKDGKLQHYRMREGKRSKVLFLRADVEQLFRDGLV